jgi:hypothetical protein
MKHFRIIPVTFFAIVALAAVGASTAAAETPEILPNPTEKEPLTFTAEGGAGRLETTGGLTIKCAKVKATGSFTSARLGTTSIDFEGCKESKTGAACNTKGDAKEIVLVNGGLHLVDYKVGAELLLGTVVSLKETLVLECSLLKDEVVGAAMGKVTGVTSGVKTKTAKLVYKETKGVQELTKCEFDKAFCEGKTYKLEANLGLGLEGAAEESEVGVTFAKEAAVDF